MPDVILNTMPNEPSTPPASMDPGATVDPPKRKLVRRAGRTEAPAASSSREESQTQPETSSDIPVVPVPHVEPGPTKRPVRPCVFTKFCKPDTLCEAYQTFRQKR